MASHFAEQNLHIEFPHLSGLDKPNDYLIAGHLPLRGDTIGNSPPWNVTDYSPALIAECGFAEVLRDLVDSTFPKLSVNASS